MQIDRKKFFDGYKDLFDPTLDQKQTDAIDFLIGAFESDPKWKDVRHVAYAFATIYHETAATLRPITEYGGVRYFDKYDTGRLAKNLGNTPEKDGDGYKYRGRGFVQITGKSNYEKFGIADRPEDALKPEVALAILSVGMQVGSFTGKKLSNFIKGSKCDYLNARKVINGTDKAALIAGYARNFEQMLRASNSAVASKPSELQGGNPTVEPLNSAGSTADSIATETKTTEVVQSGDVTKAVETTETQPKGDLPDAPATKVTTNGPLSKWLFSGGILTSLATSVWAFITANGSVIAIAVVCITVLIIVLIFRGAITDAIRMQTAADPDKKNVT